MESEKFVAYKFGWLTKQGKVMPNWKRRWFVLDYISKAMYYFTDEIKQLTEAHFMEPKGSFDISSCEYVSAGEKSVEFSIKTLDRTFKLKADSIEEKDEWLRSLLEVHTRWGMEKEEFEDFINEKTEGELRDAIKKMFDEKKNMPLVLRLSFHEAGTYDKEHNSGGVNGSLRFLRERQLPINAGMTFAVNELEKIWKQFPRISHADLYQLAGIVAVSYCGGPDIPFRFGRKDAPESAVAKSDELLPEEEDGPVELRKVFNRMGLTDKEIVLLSGAHTLGGAHKERSGHEGNFTSNPHVFDNSYYQNLLKEEIDTLRFPSDLSLVKDEKMRPYVEEYAADMDKFFRDYAEAHYKMSELGWI